MPHNNAPKMQKYISGAFCIPKKPITNNKCSITKNES